MQAIVSLLEEAGYSRIEALWRVLELRCGLKGVKMTPYPHFSWQVAENYQEHKVEKALEEIAETARPFIVKTSGLGIFTGQEPVIYVAIAKDEKLLRFHKKVCTAAGSLAKGFNPYYLPDAWVPHVTLAYGDVTKESISCAISELAFTPFKWEMRIDNLSLVGQTGEEVGQLKHRYNFSG
ncbi:MAG: 2'-5' RNA ligase family protein [Anaerolineaceae bacterium]|nr:2'-5' RNA ligase family protein [Anaerolineaceae bacterium]